MLLGVETSCDETAAAVVTEDGRILANVVSSQADLHARYGGVVPEVASRRHLELVAPVVEEALAEAGTSLDEIDAVAVTRGPGLIGALLVGISAAKAIAWSRRLPLIPVDHLHGHVASLYLQPQDVDPPFLCLLASGGHTLLLDVREREGFTVLGTTLDDAAGEAFDKGARLLGLGYPGGAAIDRLAREGDPEAYRFPVARVPGLDFSFSGLKTALLYAVRDLGARGARGPSRRPCRELPAGDRPRARRARYRGDGAGRALQDRRGRGSGRELGASLGASRRGAGAPPALHRQRGDDRLGGQVCNGRPLSGVSCARCLRDGGLSSRASGCSQLSRGSRPSCWSATSAARARASRTPPRMPGTPSSATARRPSSARGRSSSSRRPPSRTESRPQAASPARHNSGSGWRTSRRSRMPSSPRFASAASRSSPSTSSRAR